MKEDTQTRIIIEQQHAVAGDFLTQYKKGLKRCNLLKEDKKSFVTESQATKDDSSESADKLFQKEQKEQQ